MAVIVTNVTSAIWFISGKYLARKQWELATLNVVRNAKMLFVKKVIRSLRPLRVCVGGFYYLERQAKVTFVAFIVNGNIQLLLSTNL